MISARLGFESADLGIDFVDGAVMVVVMARFSEDERAGVRARADGADFGSVDAFE